MGREHLDCDWVPAAPPLAHLLPHRRLQPLQAHGEEGDGGEVCRLLFTFSSSLCFIRSSSISLLQTLLNRKKTAAALSIKCQWTKVGHIAKNQYRKSETNIPRKGIVNVQPQSEFLHSCVCERFIYSQDLSTYFLQQNRQINPGNI
jgi:hypothetical protein